MIPSQIAPELRERAKVIQALALDPDVTWHNPNVPKVWERIARTLERSADECELIVGRYLEPRKLMSEAAFTMLTRAIGSRGKGAERAARMVLVMGVPPNHAASETGLSQQAVYAATERYRKAYIVFRNAEVAEV